GALADLEDAEADQADAVALLEVLDDQADDVVEDAFGILLRHFAAVGQLGGEVLQGERRLGRAGLCGLCCSHGFLRSPCESEQKAASENHRLHNCATGIARPRPDLWARIAGKPTARRADAATSA